MPTLGPLCVLSYCLEWVSAGVLLVSEKDVCQGHDKRCLMSAANFSATSSYPTLRSNFPVKPLQGTPLKDCKLPVYDKYFCRLALLSCTSSGLVCIHVPPQDTRAQTTWELKSSWDGPTNVLATVSHPSQFAVFIRWQIHGNLSMLC